MESKATSSAGFEPPIGDLFSDLVRFETELWDLVDRRLARDHDLPLSWFEPMHVMDRVPECRVADIAKTLSITVGGTSKLVDRIESAGWCTRAPHPADARSSVLELTPAGRRLLAAARVSFEDELELRLGRAVPAERLAEFASTLQILRQYVDAQQVGQ